VKFLFSRRGAVLPLPPSRPQDTPVNCQRVESVLESPAVRVEGPAVARPAAPPRPAPVAAVRGWYAPCKRAFDVVVALLLLVLTAPLLLLSMLLVRLTSRGPALYTQTRVGRGGRPFTIYKLRTMIYRCESFTGARWAVPGDPRITPVGRFLRRTH